MVNCQTLCWWNSVCQKDLCWVPSITQCTQSRLDHGLIHYLYTDDSQLYFSFKPAHNIAHKEALCLVESCLNDKVACMHGNMLKLNTDKTEVIVFVSHRNAKFVENVSVTVSESNIKSSSCVKKTVALPWTGNGTWRKKFALHSNGESITSVLDSYIL